MFSFKEFLLTEAFDETVEVIPQNRDYLLRYADWLE